MPKRYWIIILPRASADLHAIFNYITETSPLNASGVIESLLQSIDALEYFPYRYEVHQPRRDRQGPLGRWPRPFIIYYRIAERYRVVRVLAVLHGKRKQPKRFG